MRIIAGTAGGRRLRTSPGMHTRPTADRVKEAIFSMLAEQLPGSRVLDAFAGSGALGLEALSRGADAAWFCENSAAAARICAANIEACAFPAARLIAIRPQYAPVRLGALAGEIELGPDFDEPLPDFDAYTR